MHFQLKAIFIVFSLLFFVNLSASSTSKVETNLVVQQIDSLIQEKSIDNELTQLDLLILYEDALKKEHQDSINIFKSLAKINAHLEQLDDAYNYTEKYIKGSLNFSILNDDSYNDIRESVQYKLLEDKYLTNFNFFLILVFYVSLVGFFFSILLNISKKYKNLSVRCISGFIALHSLFILEFVLFKSNLQYKLPHTFLMSSFGALLYGPLLYCYFKGVTQNLKIRKIDVLHFLPTVLLIVFLFPIYTMSSENKIRMIMEQNNVYFDHEYAVFIAKLISLVVYTVLIGRILKITNGNISNEPKRIRNWKRTIFIIQIAYVFSYAIFGISSVAEFGNVSNYINYVQIVLMSAMVLYIAYMAYMQQEIFNNLPIVSLKETLFPKYQHSGLTDSLSKELKENLLKLFEDDRIYRDNILNLEKLSEKLNTTRHNTSQIINEHFNMSFFELVNMFRIREVVDILKSDTYGNLNIIDIAYEVGYNNKVTFNKAFKKEINLTPSQYIESLRNQQSK